MPSLFRDAVPMIFIDEDNKELRRVTSVEFIPRVGENVRLGKTPYIVERVGYDLPENEIDSIWVIIRPA